MTASSLHDPSVRSARTSTRGWVATLGALLAVVGLFLLTRSFQPERNPPSVREYSEAARELGQRRTMPIGEFLPTALDSPATWTLGPGFLHPEEDGTWMAQLTAGIRFSVGAGVTPTSVVVDLEPLVATLDRDRRLTVASSVDEISLVLRGGRTKILIALDDEVEQNITISCDSVSSPIGLQLGPDRRAFCAKLHGYTINGDHG
jgi:hypothetical protein